LRVRQQDVIKKWILKRLPNALLSRAFGRLSDIAFPSPLQASINHGYARLVGADLGEAELPAAQYQTLGSFFTRRLRDGLRPIDEGEGALVSPVDGRISQLGALDHDLTLLQAKGKHYALAELLGSDEDAQRFDGGAFITLYLSPRDYHRIHAPVTGEILSMRYLPGQLLPVNPFAVRSFEALFPRNERLISFLRAEDGTHVAVVKVGATCVGRISLAYDDFITNLSSTHRPLTRHYPSPIPVRRGDELGMFNLGSTVILVVQGPSFALEPTLAPEDPVRLGMRLGRWQPSASAVVGLT
jgi:phosphatidylserine decarboxylase